LVIKLLRYLLPKGHTKGLTYGQFLGAHLNKTAGKIIARRYQLCPG
jgi:hypothetical protein